MPVLVGLQLFMGLRLLIRWLVTAYGKLNWHEYLLIPVILAVVAFYGVVTGVVAGVIAACVMFALLYGRTSCVRAEFDASTRSSTVERSIEATQRLRELGTQVCGACLQGFLFFGTANSILQRMHERMAARRPAPVRFVVLDFAATNGMDASVSVGFVKLRHMCAKAGAELVLTALPLRSRDLLQKSGTLNLMIHQFATLDAGLEWVEDRLLATHSPTLSVNEQNFHGLLAPHFSTAALDALTARLEVHEVAGGQPLFLRGEPGDAMYFIESGRVTVSLPLAGGGAVRLRSFGPGTIVGEMAVYTHKPRSADVLAEGAARVRRLSLAALDALERDDPLSAQQFHRFVVKVMASRLTVVDESLRAGH